MEYQRNISHCEPSPYIKEVTVKEVVDAANSDNLELLSFHEIGWFCISQKNVHFPDERVYIIPPDSVLPLELSEKLGVTKYLSKGRVKVSRFRGNRSEGLIAPKEIIEPYIPFIMKWEDPPSIQMQGDAIKSHDIPHEFEIFYKMPNILNEPFTFKEGEEVVFSEKIHGTNCRFGIFPHPKTGENTLYVGSHNVVLKESDSNIYWKTIKKRLKYIPQDIVFFGEIFGMGIQHLHYGKKEPDILMFAAMKNGEYLHYFDLIDLCERYSIPYVVFHKTVFKSIEQIRKFADEDSEYPDTPHREGVVVTSLESPRKMAKCIGFEYLTSKKKRTERH